MNSKMFFSFINKCNKTNYIYIKEITFLCIFKYFNKSKLNITYYLDEIQCMLFIVCIVHYTSKNII